jgi:LPXTG-motif cell wall-anchored protein
VVDAEVAASSAATNTAGLGGGVVNEMNTAVVPTAGTEGTVDSGGKEAYGQANGVSAGLGSDLPDQQNNVLNLQQTGAASSPPTRSDDQPAANSASTGLVEDQLAAVPAAPLAYADLTQTRAGAVWSDKTCIVGQPIAFGEGTVADAQLIEAGTHGATDQLVGPVVTTDSTEGQDTVDSMSFTYLVPNKNPDGTPDGTYGLATETRMELVPVTIAENPETGQGALTIQVAGTWFMRVTVTGKPGSTPLVEYGKVGVTDPTTPVIEVFSDGVSQGVLLLQDILGDTGLTLPPELNQLLQLSVGEDPRALTAPGADADPEADPILTSTSAAVAVDVARIALLKVGSPDPAPKIAEIRVGHMETKINVPSGGFKCTFPVTKVGAAQVNTGQDTTWEITIPSDPADLDAIACDIKGIDAVDHVENVSGDPKVQFSSADNGGVVSADKKTVTWTNLAYKRGDPSLKLHVTGKATAPGSFKNVVDATATLTNCQGGGFLEGSALTAFLEGAGLTGDNAVVGGATIKGTGTTAQPTVAVLAQRVLPTTGGSRALTMLGLGALLTAAGVYLFNRKVSASSSS